ncbi:hypothetical protein [Neolewinella agarilytica]|uniref:Uncharacterized protein n=1 Tax=Neolewinella agarilytica TaxID=478744 RepID=A0A1H9MGW7_9BACT|nr:hypothetical protein [Neolewinella agarilytica]SER22934.1 hypothetical protein SAMN05444359_12914 [Neolewinella agarilytica]
MSPARNLKYRYLKTKMALNQTVQSILDINRKRRVFREDSSRQEELAEELKVLNAVAENHAMRLRTYEQRLQQDDRA